jgi:peptidyl-prolyl cis-trans isomerase SurA
MLKKTVLALLVLALVAPAHALVAQAAAPGQDVIPLDRIVGVVGDTPITWYQLQERLNAKRQQGVQLPTDSVQFVALVRTTLNEMIDEEVVLQKAKELKIEVPDVDVNNSVEQQVKRVRDQFPSDAEFRTSLRQAGFGTPEEYRRMMTEQIRRNQLQQRAIDSLRRAGKLVPVPVTEADIREAFERNKGAFGKRADSITIRQIVVRTEASAAAKARAKAKAESLLAEIKAGGDFEKIAKRESMDGTKDVGGDLGWARRGMMVPAFEAWIFTMAPGQLSPVVETPFGYHIIRVDRVQPGEVKSRHILIRPEIDSADASRAGALADSVAAAWRRGANFDSLAKAHHDFGSREETALPALARTQLPEPYQKAIEGKKAGDIVTFSLPTPTGAPKFVALQLVALKEGGDPRLEDLHDRIRESLAQEGSFRRLIDGLRKRVFIAEKLDGIGPSDLAR